MEDTREGIRGRRSREKREGTWTGNLGRELRRLREKLRKRQRKSEGRLEFWEIVFGQLRVKVLGLEKTTEKKKRSRREGMTARERRRVRVREDKER